MQVNHFGLKRGREDKPVPSICAWERSVTASADNRDRVQAKVGGASGWLSGQSSSLGHCGHWAIPDSFPSLLQKCWWSPARLRYHRRHILLKHPVLDRWIERQGRRSSRTHTRWQQKRSTSTQASRKTPRTEKSNRVGHQILLNQLFWFWSGEAALWFSYVQFLEKKEIWTAQRNERNQIHKQRKHKTQRFEQNW